MDSNWIKPSSVVLVSGGARGITARCVIRLAEQVHCRFVLLGRTSIAQELPTWAHIDLEEADIQRRLLQERTQKARITPRQLQKMIHAIRARLEIEDTLQAIRRTGAQVDYVCVDITDTDALQNTLSAVQKSAGPINGILHGAGALADKWIEKKTASDFDAVFSPKIDGLENILNCVKPEHLDFLILFSSIVAFSGNRGQADYAIANEILNKTAFLIKKRHPGIHVLSIDWGPWDGGMVTPALKQVFKSHQIPLIPIEVGTGILLKELSAHKAKCPQVIVGNGLPREARAPSGNLRKYCIHRKLSLAANPFLKDHVIGEHPVVPATCAAAWMINTCEQLYPGYHFFKFENFQVLKGIVFEHALTGDYTLDLEESDRTEGDEIHLHGLLTSHLQSQKTRYHYIIDVELRRSLPQRPVFKAPQRPNGADFTPLSGSELYHDGTLFHGPAFQGVRQIQQITPTHLQGSGRLTKLPAFIQGQFPVQTANPFIYDAIAQMMLVWAQFNYSAPCLPSSIRSLEQYHPPAFDQLWFVNLEIEAHQKTRVQAHAEVYDEQGRIFLLIDGMEGTISSSLNRFIGRKACVPPEYAVQGKK